ncbi:unnamed protein product [Larinioides sclopetarius]|uniref:Thioredoxin-like fold domain-containing protein n=1 Tax=Larinioides sclopetarius TaxID=280406 RepID=A0AAV1ZZT7_9ARAC
MNDHPVIKLLGDTLLTQSGSIQTNSVIEEGKYFGLYYSAQWCPSCIAFTPELIQFYKVQKMGKNFEIIFISSDRSEESFVKYFSTMPWLAVPYSEEKTRKDLPHLYGVGGEILFISSTFVFLILCLICFILVHFNVQGVYS